MLQGADPCKRKLGRMEGHEGNEARKVRKRNDNDNLLAYAMQKALAWFLGSMAQEERSLILRGS